MPEIATICGNIRRTTEAAVRFALHAASFRVQGDFAKFPGASHQPCQSALIVMPGSDSFQSSMRRMPVQDSIVPA